MRRSNCAAALQYVPELTWILLLPIPHEREAREAERARAVSAKKDEDTPEELLDLIEAKGREVADAIAALRKML
ncbi:MAG: hypothetical protein HY727_12220 [Candidatus Rokubacteria bacterium]|nr:hypothetical protein [Candidatus Rokubacteria bacterium]